MRYCGNCGAPISAGELTDGVCSRCGARITPSGDVIAPFAGSSSISFGDAPTNPPSPASPSPLPGADAAPPRWTVTQRAQAALPPPSSPLPVLLGGAVVVLVLAVGILLAVVLRHSGVTVATGNGSPNKVGSSSHSGEPTSTGQPTQHKTPTPQGQPTATPAITPTAQPTGTAQPAGTPTPTPTATSSPAIFVMPNALNVPDSACLSISGADGSFQLSNDGGGQLIWNATASSLTYKIMPNAGTLSAGAQPVTITVSHIHSSGSVTITSPNASNSPQTISVACSAAP